MSVDQASTPSPAAHELWVELQTRVASQSLHQRSGDEESAAASVAGLFATGRRLMIAHPGDREFVKVTEVMLNQALRPHTARWHGWIKNGQLKVGSIRRQFRAELAFVRRILRIYARGYSYLARSGSISRSFRRFLDESKNRHKKLAGFEPMRSRFLTGVLPARGDWGPIEAAEQVEIKHRRRALGLPSAGDEEVTDAVGLALSGGGIRSATFSLGIIKVLARKGLGKEIDYLSTVSGGGYFGSFLSSYLGGSEGEEPAPAGRRDPMQGLFSSREGQHEATALRHLRNNSQYLMKGGVTTKLQILGLILSGVVTNLLIVGLAVVLFAVLFAWGDQWLGYWKPVEVGQPWHATFFGGLSLKTGVLAAGCWGVLAYFLHFSRNAREGSGGARLRSLLIRGNLALLLLAVLFAGLSVVPAIHRFLVWLSESKLGWLGGINKEFLAFIGTGVLPVLFGGGLAVLHGRGLLRRLVWLLFTLSGPVFYFATFLLTLHLLTFEAPRLPLGWFTVGALVVLVWVFFLNINVLSPHTFYRNRLCDCYLVADRNGTFEEINRRTLSTLNPRRHAPYHLLNATAQLPSSDNLELRGRESDFFLFSKHYCGSPLVGYGPTRDFEGCDAHVDLGTALAISGAAANSNMGLYHVAAYRFILTLFNLRLGYWLRIPRSVKSEPGIKPVDPDVPSQPLRPDWWKGFKNSFAFPNSFRLLNEMTATGMDENKSFVNVSDGGHIENYGIYELLRRRCKFVIAIEGANDPEMTLSSFRQLQRLARIDLDVEIEMDASDLSLNEERLSESHSAVGKIRYPATEDHPDGETGWILLIKLALTGEEKDDVLDYRRTAPLFPHESTGDQLFSEDQFEAYRSLGETAAENLFRDEVVKQPDREGLTIASWFEHLVANLMPDNQLVYESTAERRLREEGGDSGHRRSSPGADFQ